MKKKQLKNKESLIFKKKMFKIDNMMWGIFKSKYVKYKKYVTMLK